MTIKRVLIETDAGMRLTCYYTMAGKLYDLDGMAYETGRFLYKRGWRWKPGNKTNGTWQTTRKDEAIRAYQILLYIRNYDNDRKVDVLKKPINPT